MCSPEFINGNFYSAGDHFRELVHITKDTVPVIFGEDEVLSWLLSNELWKNINVRDNHGLVANSRVLTFTWLKIDVYLTSCCLSIYDETIHSLIWLIFLLLYA